jgi:hypothetical protein
MSIASSSENTGTALLLSLLIAAIPLFWLIALIFAVALGVVTWRREGAARAMRPSLGAGKSGEAGTVNSGEETAMAIPSHKVGSGTNQETEHCLDSFLGVLEYLSEATGLSIEDIADLLSSEEGPVGAMVLAGHLQATTKPQTD